MGLKERLSKRATEVVDLGGDVGEVRIRRLSGYDLARLTEMEAAKSSSADDIRIMCYVVAASLVDDDGGAVYQTDDLEAVEQMDSYYMRAIAEAAMEFSGLSDAAQESLKKTSTTTPPLIGGSSSGLLSESQTLSDYNDDLMRETLPDGASITRDTPLVGTGNGPRN